MATDKFDFTSLYPSMMLENVDTSIKSQEEKEQDPLRQLVNLRKEELLEVKKAPIPPALPIDIKDEDFHELCKSFGVQSYSVFYEDDGSLDIINLHVKTGYYTALSEHLVAKFGSLDWFKITVGTMTFKLE